MQTDSFSYSVVDHIARVRFARPKTLGSLTFKVYRDLTDLMYQLRFDDNVKVVVIEGEGRGFCSGADISMLSGLAQKGLDPALRAQALEPLGGEKTDVRRDFQIKYSYFPSLSKPVIAAINGPSIGLGLVIALYCDIRLASDAARLHHRDEVVKGMSDWHVVELLRRTGGGLHDLLEFSGNGDACRPHIA